MFFFQAEDGIRDLVRSRGLGDVYKRQILIRANTHLKNIAAEIGVDLPNDLVGSMAKSITQLENLWDQDSKYYYSRNFATHELLKIPAVASLLPL